MTQSNHTAERSVLHLTGDMNFRHAAEQQQRLAQALAEHSNLDVDLSGVRDFDTAGLQLLLAARKQTASVGQELRFVAHSASVQGVLEFLRLDGCLSGEEGVRTAGEKDES